jgi:hypothetical protein
MIKYLHRYTKAVANPNAGSTQRVACPAKPFLDGYLVDISPRAIMTAKQLFRVSGVTVTVGIKGEGRNVHGAHDDVCNEQTRGA